MPVVTQRFVKHHEDGAHRTSAMQVTGTDLVQVIFRGEKGDSWWLMHKDTYRALPLGTHATVSDYAEHGLVVESSLHAWASWGGPGDRTEFVQGEWAWAQTQAPAVIVDAVKTPAPVAA